MTGPAEPHLSGSDSNPNPTGGSPADALPVAAPATQSAFGDDPVGVEAVPFLAAALRADVADLETYERVLANTIADALPLGMLEIERNRSLSDRVANRPGKVVAIAVHLGELTLELRAHHSSLVGTVRRTVRGVAISSKEVRLDEWTQLFAEQLARLAAENTAARAAIARMLGTM